MFKVHNSTIYGVGHYKYYYMSWWFVLPSILPTRQHLYVCYIKYNFNCAWFWKSRMFDHFPVWRYLNTQLFLFYGVDNFNNSPFLLIHRFLEGEVWQLFDTHWKTRLFNKCVMLYFKTMFAWWFYLNIK